MSFDYSRLSLARPGSPIAVAEIGTAHGGDLQRGLDLIDAAADTGADIAKLQVVIADEILPPEAGLVPLPGGPTPLFDVFRALERPAGFYAALAERAEERGIGFLASPFGMESAALLEDIGVRAWKVASPELNHEPLLERLAATGLPLILSTGVAQPADIERALELVSGTVESSPPLILLHCVTNYPAPENEANLRAIPAMAAAYGRPVGLSDHSLHPVLLPALAAALGAVMVEKHITLNRSAGGLDDPVALVPEDFARMTAAMKRFSRFASGDAAAADGPRIEGRHSLDGDALVPADPPGLSDAVRELSAEYGAGRVEACLGDGMKKPAPSEEAHYGRTNRSLHAVGALEAGTVLTDENTALLRTEKVLRPGIPPRNRREAYGRRLLRDIASGDGITWDDIGSAETP